MRPWTIRPAGEVPALYLDAIKQAHLLIAGQTGSGKSVLLNGIIRAILTTKAPSAAQLILIDPKRVELIDYRDFPHTLNYASEPDQMLSALHEAMVIIDRRFFEMQRNRQKLYAGGDVYLIIDELADLMTTQPKEIEPILTRIGQIGRAARVHLIVCTQHILSSVISSPIKVNLSAAIGLRTRNRQDSRNIIGAPGLESLPMHGQAIYSRPGHDLEQVEIPYLSDEEHAAEVERLLNWWTDTKHQFDTRGEAEEFLNKIRQF